MRKRVLIAASAVAALAGISANSAMADPPTPAGDAAFVCPVLKLSDQAFENTGGTDGKFNRIGDGEYTFGTGNAGDPVTFTDNVPLNATNGEGEGTPGSDHSSPGDTDYTPIWSGDTDPPQ
jgi:hypothetical protein